MVLSFVPTLPGQTDVRVKGKQLAISCWLFDIPQTALFPPALKEEMDTTGIQQQEKLGNSLNHKVCQSGTSLSPIRQNHSLQENRCYFWTTNAILISFII